MSLHDFIVVKASENKRLTAEDAWSFAVKNGYGNPHGEGGGGGWKAWCAVAVSLMVFLASAGLISLAFDQEQKLVHERFKTGNASARRISDDARARHCSTQEPRPGMPVIVEVRSPGKDGSLPAWTGKRCHIAIVIALVKDAAGKVIAVKTWEPNLAHRTVWGFRRPLIPGEKAHERILEFVDVEEWARQKGLFDLVRPELQPAKPDGAEVWPAEEGETGLEPAFQEGYEVEGEVADGDGRKMTLRCVACDIEGGFQAVEVFPDGTVGDRIYRSADWVATGSAHSHSV